MGEKYGFRKLAYNVKGMTGDGWVWVNALDVKGGELVEVKWGGEGDALTMSLVRGITMCDIEEYAKILGCEFVLISEEE